MFCRFKSTKGKSGDGYILDEINQVRDCCKCACQSLSIRNIVQIKSTLILDFLQMELATMTFTTNSKLLTQVKSSCLLWPLNIVFQNAEGLYWLQKERRKQKIEEREFN